MALHQLPLWDDSTSETPIPLHYHLNLVIENPIKVKFVLTDKDNNVTDYLDIFSGEPVCFTKFYEPKALTFSEMIEQVQPMDITGYCLITSDETIIANMIHSANIPKLLAFFPDYTMQPLEQLGSDSDLVVIAQHKSIDALVDAIKRNFITDDNPNQE